MISLNFEQKRKIIKIISCRKIIIVYGLLCILHLFRVQELFKLSLTASELRLKVIKTSGLEGLRKPPPPIYPTYPDDKENVSMVECEQKRK